MSIFIHFGGIADINTIAVGKICELLDLMNAINEAGSWISFIEQVNAEYVYLLEETSDLKLELENIQKKLKTNQEKSKEINKLRKFIESIKKIQV